MRPVLSVTGWLSRGTGPDLCGARIWRHAAASAVSGRWAAWVGISRWSAGGRAVHQFSGGHGDGRDHGDRGPRADAPGQGCEPPIAARYTAVRPAAAAGPDTRYQSRAHQAPRRTARRPGHGGRSAVRRGTLRLDRGRRPQTTGTWECRSWALRYLLVPAGQYHCGRPRLLTRCLRQTVSARDGSSVRARSGHAVTRPGSWRPSPADKTDRLIERYNPP